MNVLNIKTKGSALIVEKPIPRITSGGRNCYTLRVTFDSSWDCQDGKLSASFYIDKPEDAIIRELTPEDETCFSCFIPNAMLNNEGFFKIGVFCESEDRTKTSDVKMVRVHQGAVTSNTGENETDIAVNSAKEEYRNELETSLETATGENHDNKTWEELNELIVTVIEEKNEMFAEVERVMEESGVLEYDSNFKADYDD